VRPKAIGQGELVYLASVGVLLATSAIGWTDMVAQAGLALAGGVTAFTLGLFLLLILLATRRGSRVALWFLVALTAFGALSFLYQIATGQVVLGLLGVLNAVQVGLTVIGAVLLFRPAARAFFAVKHADWEEDA
jgi:hypothetical protein